MEIELIENKKKRKVQYDFHIDKLQAQIVEAKRDHVVENLKEILDTMVQNGILEYEVKEQEIDVVNREIRIIKFKNPPEYMKRITGTSGRLQVYKNAQKELSLYYWEKSYSAHIKIRDEGIWSLLIEAILQYSTEYRLHIWEENINTNDNCGDCGEQLITYMSSCRDSYCCEAHQYEKCYKC